MEGKIIIYGRAGCAQCHASRRKAEDLGLDYRYVDLDQDEDTAHRLQMEGHRTLPVVETDDMTWVGFRPDLLGGCKA